MYNSAPAHSRDRGVAIYRDVTVEQQTLGLTGRGGGRDGAQVYRFDIQSSAETVFLDV